MESLLDSNKRSHFPYCPQELDPYPFTSAGAKDKMVSMQHGNNWNPNPTLYYPCHREDGTPVPDLQQLLLQKLRRGNQPRAPITRIISEPFAPICVESLMTPVKCPGIKNALDNRSFEEQFLAKVHDLDVQVNTRAPKRARTHTSG